MDTAVTIAFADGDYRFALPVLLASELKVKTKLSVFELRDLVGAGLAFDDGVPVYVGGGGPDIAHVLEVVRLALIGGNEGPAEDGSTEVGPIRANRLVGTYCYPERPAIEALAIAWRVLDAAITGIAVKKKDEPDAEVPPKAARTRSRKAPSSSTAGP